MRDAQQEDDRTAAGLSRYMGILAEALGTDEDRTELADGLEVHTVGPVILVVARDDGDGAMVEGMTVEEARTFCGLVLSAIEQARKNGG